MTTSSSRVRTHLQKHQDKYSTALAVGAGTLLMRFILFPLARLLLDLAGG